MSATMQRFIDEVGQIVQAGGSEATITAKVADRMKLILDEPDLIPVEFTQPLEKGNALYPVYVAEDGGFSIAAAVWGVGQITGIHDHGSWGVIGIYQGAEGEERFLRQPDVALDEAASLSTLGQRTLARGEVVVCCTSDKDLHRVRCASAEPSVGIHVYGANIGTISRHFYHPDTGIAEAFVTSWDEPPSIEQSPF
jgi:predicted metal-dependent enzyme (double-stranded beta helix superfamily)